MKTIGKLMIAAICVAFTGCGMADPWKKWEGEGELSADRLLPSELKTALCAQEWWKTQYAGKEFFFSFSEDGKVKSSSTFNEKPLETGYNIDWSKEDQVIVNFTGKTHLEYLDASAKELTILVNSFTEQQIDAVGKDNAKTIKLLPGTQNEYQAMEDFKLNYNLYTEFDSYVIPTTAGELKVKVVGGDYTVQEPEADWLTFVKKDGDYAVFSYTAYPHRFRSAEVVMNQTTPDGEQLTHKIVVSGTKVVNFTNTYAKADFKGAAVVNSINVLSYEALVCPTGFPRMINSVMGTEGQFLIRCGDANYPADKIQIATNAGNVNPGDGAILPTNRWTHIAVTMSETHVCTYINGVKVNETAKNTWVNISNFYLGFSYSNGREFTGYMAEMRLWNKALTEAEINAENHFYNVDPKSEGLVAYWRCDDGAGTVLADATNGYNCNGAWAGDSVWGPMPMAYPLP